MALSPGNHANSQKISITDETSRYLNYLNRSVRNNDNDLLEVETSFKMPKLLSPQLSPQNIEKSRKMNQIYQQKQFIEKQYGDIAK